MITKIFKIYPKKRPPLDKALQKIFNFEYKKNRTNLLSQLSESWLHFSIRGRKQSGTNTLELGAGTLNHLKYEKLENKIYDVIEPKKFLYANSKYKKKVCKFYSSIKKVPENYYDRIISCATLEHLEDLPYFLFISAKKMKKNGYQSHSIPCEGYPTWNFVWWFFSGIIFRLRTGFSFRHIQKYEHLNNHDEIVKLIRFFYKEYKISYSYPSYFSPYLSFYANITFCNPNKKNIKIYQKKLKNL